MIPVYKPYLPDSSLKYAHDALDSTWLSSSGKYLPMVQEKLQELLDVKYVIPVNNGTSACHMVAKSLTRKYQKNKIIVPNNVYVAAWNAFLFDNEYELLYIDSDLKSWNFDLEKLDRHINYYPEAAVLVVHNVGNIINVPELKIKYPKTIFVEDNCEGFLGKYENKYTGTESFASAISFFGNKNITSGEGGAFITNDEETYLYAKCIHGQGQSEKRFVHKELGYNYRMTNIQAAILLGQLEILPEIINRKAELFNKYRTRFQSHHKIMPQSINLATEHSNWMFGIRLLGNTGYEEAESFFKARGIEIRPMFYSIMEHSFLQDNIFITGVECANAKLLNKECFILPSYPELTDDEINYICKTVEEYSDSK